MWFDKTKALRGGKHAVFQSIFQYVNIAYYASLYFIKQTLLVGSFFIPCQINVGHCWRF